MINNQENSGYASLFIETSYSLLSSTIRIKELVNKSKDFGITSLAITDCHNLFGAMEFSLECQKAGIHGIIGCKAKLEGNREILLYIENKIGYQNLSYLLTDSYTRGDNYIRWEQLIKKSEGLVAIALPSLISSSNLADLEACARQLDGGIKWYVGVEPDVYHNESAYMSQIFKTPIVAVSRACFMYENEQKAHDVMICIREKKYSSEVDRPKSSSGLKLLNSDEFKEKFASMPFAIKNASRLAEKLSFALFPSKPQLPKLKMNRSQEVQLKQDAINGLENRFKQYNILNKAEYYARLDHELGLIESMGFAGYFIIVSDFIKFAKQNNIMVGPGRGSGSGSLVAWCTYITEIDPIRFDLYFERFLNPGRISMPDFDIDFSPNGREDVIQYVRDKYGSNRVSGIITFGSLSSRAVLKDVGRVLHQSYQKIDHLSKKIQVVFGKPFTLQETYERDASFAEEINADEELQEVFEVSKVLEGLYRHVSAHAAGILISNTPIHEICPLYRAEDCQIMIAQFSMKYAEMAGLVKFDFLGLTALDVIKGVIDEVRKYKKTTIDTKAHKNSVESASTILLDGNQEDKINTLDKAVGTASLYEKDSVNSFNSTDTIIPTDTIIDINTIPLDDEKTFKLLLSGNTKGIFQFETRGMTKLIKEMNANSIDDLIAIVALYRPGPMDNIPLFIRSKEGLETIKYKYPKVNEILKNTYGIIVYQEQIIKIAEQIAGFSMAEADLLRRAMGKKIPEEMKLYRKKFIDGTVKTCSGSQEDAEEIFNQIDKFANYGFNKAHAVAYAIIGYQQAYLKAHHILDFVSVSMTTEQHKTDKLADLIVEAKNMKITILPPCVNKSEPKFIIVNESIRYSLSAIKNIGEHAANHIVENRKKHGPFTSFANFIERLNLSKRDIEFLSMSGALDTFKTPRSVMFEGMQNIAIGGLFTSEDLTSDREEWPEEERLTFQKNALGVYIDKHPVENYPIKQLDMNTLGNVTSKECSCYILIHKISHKLDKKKRPYGICNISDHTGIFDAIISNEDALEMAEQLIEKVIIAVCKNQNGRIIISNFSNLSDRLQKIQSIHIRTKDKTGIQQLIEQFKGADISIYIHIDKLVESYAISQSNILRFVEILQKESYQWKGVNTRA